MTPLQTPKISSSGKSKRKLRLVVLLFSFVTASLMLGSATLKGQDPLRKYGDVSVFPMEDRRAEFRRTSSTEKSNLFRIHLALYVAKHPELSEGQRHIVLDGMSLATPERYDVQPNSPDWKIKVEEPVKQFQSRVLSSFSKDEAAKIFTTLGESEPQDPLFQKYREISELPILERKAAFRNASPRDKSDVWRVQLALHIAKNANLSGHRK